jgi:hypothetical protein
MTKRYDQTVPRECLRCSREFMTSNQQVNRGHGKYCSRECRAGGSLYERIDARIEKVGDCWICRGRTNGRGYAMITDGGKSLLVHQVMYQRYRGEIPIGLEPDHTCRLTLCVNPDHLEPVTHRENILRGTSPAALNAQKSHCPSGHAYDTENTRHTPGGGRICRACHREDSTRRYHERKKVAA